MIELRLATAADVDAIVSLHIESWRATYRGMYSDRYLDHEIVAERQQRWRERFEDRSARWTLLAEDGGDLVGFVHLELDEEPSWGPLLENLHASPARKRQGIGRLLMAQAAAHVVEVRPREPMHLWVLDANANARAFYAALHGDDVETSLWSSPDGGTVLSHRIVWYDPSVLI